MKVVFSLLAAGYLCRTVLAFFCPARALGAGVAETLEVWGTRRRFLIHSLLNGLLFAGVIAGACWMPEDWVREYKIFLWAGVAVLFASCSACNWYNLGSGTLWKINRYDSRRKDGV